MKKFLPISIVGIMALSFPGIVNAQNLFQADSGSGNIYEYTPSGVQSVFASGLNTPNGLAFNSAGDLFVTLQASGDIAEFTPNGAESIFASGLNSPTGLVFDSAGNLYEADYNSGNIYEFTPAGARTTFASGLSGPVYMAFDSAGNLFVGAQLSDSIIKITPGGAKSVFASGINPNGLAFNSAGDLFEGDAYSGNIYEFTPGGARSTFASGFSSALGLTFDSAGNLLVCTWLDPSGDSIYKLTPSGAKSTFVTGLNYPESMAFQPVPKPSVFNFNAFVNAVSISTNKAGNLVYRAFGNRDLIQSCASQMDITNLMGLYLVYDLGDDALEVVRGCGTNQTLVCTPLTFSGGVFLGNANATKSERQAWVYWDGQATPSGTLTATESYGYGASNQLTRFSLCGQLQFTLPGNGTNKPTIYQGSIVAGSRSSFQPSLTSFLRSPSSVDAVESGLPPINPDKE